MGQVSSLINYLTNDEDLRQELWVHYLSGNPVESFSTQLNKLHFEYSQDAQLKKNIWFLIKNPPQDNLIKFLENFTEFERSIICLIMLDLSPKKISEAKGISEVRIRQVISTIRYNSIWSRYGIKEELIGR
jgi:hypothetical protein